MGRMYIALTALALVLIPGIAGATTDPIEISQPVQISSDSHYERGNSALKDGDGDFWLFWGRHESFEGNYGSGNPDDSKYEIFYKKAGTVAGLETATALPVGNMPTTADKIYQGQTSCVEYGTKIWVFAVDTGANQVKAWTTDDDGATWPVADVIPSGLGSFEGSHLWATVYDDGGGSKIWLAVNRGGNLDVTTYDGVSWSAVSTAVAHEGLVRFFVDSGNLYLYYTSWALPDSYDIHQYTGASPWPVVASITGTPEDDSDPMLTKLGTEYVFIFAPWNGTVQYLKYWTASSIAGFNGLDETSAYTVTAGKYGTTYWVDMWPATITDGSDVYLFYGSEADGTTSGTGNIQMLALDWALGRDHFCYIQNAVDAATGTVLNVAAGMYTEQVTIDKSLELLGAGESTTTIQAPPSGRATITEGIVPWDYVIAADGDGSPIDVKIAGFTIDANAQNATAAQNLCGVFLRDVGDGTNDGLYSSTVTNFGGYFGGWSGTLSTWNGNTGVVVYGTSDLAIDDNDIDDYTVSGVSASGSNVDVVVNGNDLDGAASSYVGLFLRDGTGTITGNAIYDHDGVVENMGIYVYDAAPGVTIESSNTINGNYVGVFLKGTDGVTVDGNAFTDNTYRSIVIQQDSDNNVVSDNTITMSGLSVKNAIYIGSDSGGNVIGGATAADGNTITIPSNTTHAAHEPYVIHFATGGANDGTVQNNTLNNGARAVQIDGGNSGTYTISANTIEMDGLNSSNMHYAVGVNAGNAAVTGNTLTNTQRPLECFGAGTIEFTDNTVSTGFFGVNLGSYTGDPIVTGNAFLGFGGNGNVVWNQGAGDVDATSNWWGDTDPSDNVNNSGSGSIDYSPWWGANYVGDPHTTAWTWYVDDTIQDAVDAASSGDIVQVAAGTYAESLTIDKALTLSGDSGATLIPGSGIIGIVLRNDDITIQGLTIHTCKQGILGWLDTPHYQANFGYANIHILDNVIYDVDHLGSPGHGFAIYLGTESERYDPTDPLGIYDPALGDLLDFTGLLIQGNEIYNTSGAAITLQSMRTYDANPLEVSDNYIHDAAASGTWVDAVSDLLFQHNTFEGSANGIFLSNYGDGYYEGTPDNAFDPKNITIQQNIFQGQTSKGIAIYDAYLTDLAIDHNSIVGNAAGLYSFFGTQGPIPAEHNWWGDASGPTHAGNPGGTGDSASDGIDYDPWIGKSGGENVVCDPEPLELSEAVSMASLDVDYLGGGTAGVRTVHIVFTWDAADVDLTGIVQGDLFGAEPSQFFSFIGTGTATVDWSLTGLPEEINPASGPGTIFTPTFAAVAACDSDLDPEIVFTEIIFRDAYNNNITGIYARDGEITVDTNDPVVASLVYDNSLPHAEAFVKTDDIPTLSATVTDGCADTGDLTIVGDFSTLVGNTGWDAQAPTSLVGTTASWVFPTDDLSADGTYTVTLTATDDLGNEGTATFDIKVDNTAPTAITAVAAGPGHNEIDLTWADPSGLDANYYAVELWRTAWGAYPEYDDDAVAPSYPAPPGTGTLVTGVPTGTLTSFTETFASDGSQRDVYYYTVVVIDKALNKGPAVASAQDRSTNYWLGDVAPTTPDLGNGRVFSEDISVLSSTYFKIHGEGGYLNTCDVGPTDDMSRTGIPTTDNVINFEDLIVFSMNYDVDSPEGRSADGPGGQAMPVALDLRVPADVPLQPGARMVVSAVLSDEGASVKGARFVVHYNERAFVCRGVHEGALVADCGGFFRALVQDGTADISAAAMGRGLTLGGSGTVAELTFEVRGGADPEISLEDVTLRNVANKDLRPTTSTIDLPLVSTDVIPTNVFLRANRPNPFAGMTHMDFGLPQAAPVKLAVYDVSGRLVRTLINGELSAGEHSVQWDRTQADGTPVPGGLYFYRLETPTQVMTRKMIVSE